MGKQVQFYMTEEDEKAFVLAIHRKSPVKLIYNTFADTRKMELKPLQPVGTTLNDANLSILNPAFESRIRHDFVAATSTYCIDLAESELVQFNRCKLINTWLANGRLWFEESYHEGKKSPEFLKWANSLLRWIKNNYQRDETGVYVSRGTLDLASAGTIRLGPPTDPTLRLEERKRILGI